MDVTRERISILEDGFGQTWWETGSEQKFMEQQSDVYSRCVVARQMH